MSASPFTSRNSPNSSASSPAPASSSSTMLPVFTPAFGHHDDEDDEENVDEQLAYGLSLDSPPAYVFSNDLAFEPSVLDADNEIDMDAHEGKAAAMRSVPTQRDTSAFGFEPLITPRSFEGGFVETNIFESTSGKAPVFVLDQMLPSPLNYNAAKSFGFFTPTILKSDAKKVTPSSPLSPAGFLEIPEKERSDFFLSVNPTFTSSASPSTITDTITTALATLHCEFATSKSCQWTLDVRCLLVAEEISFAIHLLQLRGAETKYEIEFVRRSGDELVFVDFAEHIRAQCSDVDDDGALALFNQTLDAWLDDKQELTARRYVIQETEAAALLDELNCEFLHTESLYQVARSVKNHCRHKSNRKLFAQQQHAKSLVKGLKWMLTDSDELARFALFVLLQFAGDADLCGSFFPTPFEKSSVSLLLDALDARKDESPSKFTTEMVAAVRQSALFA